MLLRDNDLILKGDFMDDKGFVPQYDDKKQVDKILFGKAIPKGDGTYYRKAEMIVNQNTTYLSSKNKDINSEEVVGNIKDEIILYESDGGQQKIHCWLIETETRKYPTSITISRRTGKGAYGSQEVTLLPETALKFRAFLNNITFVDTSNKGKFAYDIKADEMKTSSKKMITVKEFEELIKENIDSIDDFYSLLIIKKRRVALERFKDIINGDYKNEVDIQHFLKMNLWLFGNEYSFVVENNKINSNNILDVIPRNIENCVDIIEVKLPNEKLFNFDESHKNFYPTSHLTKAISQVQNYIFEFENKAGDAVYQRENDCLIIKPRAIILIGSKEELSADEMKYLRILNSSYHNISIVTYQQLLSRAENMLKIDDGEKK